MDWLQDASAQSWWDRNFIGFRPRRGHAQLAGSAGDSPAGPLLGGSPIAPAGVTAAAAASLPLPGGGTPAPSAAVSGGTEQAATPPLQTVAAVGATTATPATAALTVQATGSSTALGQSAALPATVTTLAPGSAALVSTSVDTAQSTVLTCCGSCGYVNCPTRAMEQGGSGFLGGQLPSNTDLGLPDGMIAVHNPTVSNSLFFPSTTQVLPSATLPGGGETVANPPATTGEIGILGGSVTKPVVSPPKAAGAIGGSAAALSTDAPQGLAAAAATSTNPIVLENQKTGNPESEWGIDGAGDSNIEGFATDISVNHGTKIDFKINTNSTNYRIDIYRLGYYGGMGARKVGTIQHTGLQNQPTPLKDAATGLVDAGNWSVSASWNVPADAVSGVYIAKLVRQDGVSGENHIPFIVRDDSSHSDVVFQTADETWQAYNGWGGANFYGGNGPATGQGAGRAYAVSYNRPIATRGGVGTYAGPQDYLFGAEYAGIYWLEQNGYDVSYMAGVDVDRYGSLLLNHKAYVDAGHDEYWSGQQRANVEAARDAGVNLQFWSGNEVYWRTRWGKSISSDQTDYRTLISYKETWGNGVSLDPTDQWTGTFRDPRLSPPAIGGGAPENSLTGQLFQVDDVGGALESITVPYDDANLRFWRNTSVANLTPGQTATLTKNYLGYEWDEAPDNGFDPAGLVKLSSTTLDVNTYLLDYGNTTGPGTATHNLTLYRAPSGALVFGAGTVYWTWALSDNHDKEVTPTDARIQQAMVNLFADMGIQPGTLQSGLITGTASTDHTAPTTTITTPGTGASIVAEQLVTITGTAADAGGGVIAGVEVSTDNGASWHPATGDENWTYSWAPQVAGTYTIRTRAVDDSVNLETPGAGRTVTVTPPDYITLFAGNSVPAVVNTSDASAVELGVKFKASVAGTVTGIRFYKGSLDIGTHTGTLWSSAGAKLGTLTFTNETASGWQTATFSSPITITAGQTYTASYHTNVGHYSNSDGYFTADVVNGALTAPAAGNGVFAYGSASTFPTETFDGTNYWVDVMFKPGVTGPNQAPTAVNDSGPQVTRDTPASIAASLLLANDTDPDGDVLTVTGAAGGVNGTATFNAQTNAVTFTPTAGYTGAASFTYTISDGHSHTATANVSLNVVAPGQTPLSLFSATAAPTSSYNEGQQLELGTKFQSTVAGQITALRFYRSAGDTGTDLLSLWNASGTKLASVTFSNTTATGWQTVNLPTPVTIAPNTTYVTSYHTNGAYVATNAGFTSGVTNGPLSAPATTGVTGGNGVYAYGGTVTAGIFPTSTWNASNYYADVVFIAGPTAPNTTPTAVADTGDATEKGGANNTTGGSAATGNVLTNDTDPDSGDTKTVTAVSFGATTGTLGTALVGAHGSLVLNATGGYTYTVNETDAAVQALRLATNTITDSFTYTMRDTAGATSSSTLTVTIHGNNDAPALNAQTANQSTVVNQPFFLQLPPNTFIDVDAGDTETWAATAGDGSSLPAWLTFDPTPTAHSFSGTPTAIGTQTVRVTSTDASGASAVETFNIVVTATPNAAPTAVADAGDATEKGGPNNTTGGSAAIGNVLTNDTDPDAGDTKAVTAVKFGATNGTLGTALAGTYGSLVLNAAGGYTYTVNETNSVVQALRLSTNTIADTFTYTMRDAAGATSSSTLTVTIHGANDAPVLAVQTANQNAVAGTPFTLALPAGTFTDVDAGDTRTYTATAADGTALPAWLNFNAANQTFTGTPAAANAGTLGVKVTATDAGSLAASETFNIAVAPSAPVSLFTATQTPANTNANDTNAVELGVQFRASTTGTVSAIKFYKSTSDTGTHTGTLWSSTGTKLATVTFANETASGWQTATFSTPVAITAGTTYTASYHTNAGRYAYSSNYFATAVTNGPLTAPATTNGVFAYGAASAFPTTSFNRTNYWVDVVFNPSATV